MPGLSVKNISHLEKFFTYELPAKKEYYSIFFEVITSAGSMNISLDNFSKISHVIY